MDEIAAPAVKRMKGWPKGLTRPMWAIAKVKGHTLDEAGEAIKRGDKAMFEPPPNALAKDLERLAKPKPPANRADDWRTRHQLRDPFDYPVDMSPGSRFHIDRGEFPEGFDLNWKVSKIWQQPQSSEMARDRRMGWVPVMHGDFDGKFDGRWLPDTHVGEIEIDGLVLCARPLTWSARAKLLAEREAKGQLQIKVDQIKGGHLPGVTMDTQHPTALAANRIGSDWERVQTPMTAQDK